MPVTYITREGFEYIEAIIERTGHGVTAEEFAIKFGIKQNFAASWLSKWASKGYLKYVPTEYVRVKSGHPGRSKGSMGQYVMGDHEWAELVYTGNKNAG